MKVYNTIEEFNGCLCSVVTAGTFDGVHLGHKKIIDRLKDVAKKCNGETVLLTFHPHPRLVLQPEDNELKLINTINERIELLDRAGIDHLIVHPFTQKFSRLSSVEFVRDILSNKLQTKKLVIGYNHHFGRNREGSFEHLLEYGPLYGFDVEEISARDLDNVNVSSTKIRQAIESGDVEMANKYLGYNFVLSGKVVNGNKLGRDIGFPTANLAIEDHKIIPATGVYVVGVKISGEEFVGMMNIGFRPTMNKSKKLVVEVHIIEFDQEIYGETIEMIVKSRIRSERKFDNVSQLKEQLEADKLIAINA